MKVTWTANRKTLGLVVPREFEASLSKMMEKAEKNNAGFVTITIENVRKPRTTGEGSQSHHLNGHIQQIAQETGNPFEVVKLEVKVRAVEMGYPILVKEDGSVQKDLYGRVMGISEADSSIQECAILIEATHMIASELGIILKETE